MKDRATSESDELRLLFRVMRMIDANNATVAIDGGANVGNWSAELAKFFRLVYAFEPVGFVFTELSRRANEFGCTSLKQGILPIQCALFDRECFVKMVSPPKRHASTAFYVSPVEQAEQWPASPRDPPDVLAITIDRLNLQQCGLIKLDLEGAELRALVGARETLKRCRPVLIVEYVPRQLARYGDTPQGFDLYLESMGYQLSIVEGVNRVYIPC